MTDRLLGELIAEIRIVKHNQNNASQKLDAVAVVAATQTEMIHQMERLESEVKAASSRIGVLEADKNRREGAIGLVAWISKNWPVMGILAALAAFVAFATGVDVKGIK